MSNCIGMDIDDVLVKNPINFWDLFPGVDVSSYAAYEKDYRASEIKELFSSTGYYKFGEAKRGAWAFLELFGWVDIPVQLITARPICVKKETIDRMLSLFGIPETRIHFSDGNDKVQIALDLSVTVWVDDNEKDVLRMTKAGIDCFHMINVPWGKNVVEGAIRSKSLLHVAATILTNLAGYGFD